MNAVVLSIALAGLNAVLRFTTPTGEHGNYYLLSSEPGGWLATVEACGHVSGQEHAVLTTANDGHRLFWVLWVPDSY